MSSTKEFSDKLICSCLQIKASTIEMAILSGKTQSVEEISAITGAGTACRACICRIERITLGLSSKCVDCNECPAKKSKENIWECA